jgi:6-phospho-beta-glucosidase
MAGIKLVYVGGGSTRAPGTMAALIAKGASFAGSEVVLVDLHAERLALVERLAKRMAEVDGVDLAISSTTDRRAALDGCDAVLTSFRPGGFEHRVLDERIPLEHGVIGQETQGPGGFFMALRAIKVMQQLSEEIGGVCPDATVFNYTNPINIVSEAMTRFSGLTTYSFCEGPIYEVRTAARIAGVDPERVRIRMVGLNHGSWTVEARYDDEELIPLIQQRWEETRGEGFEPFHRRALQIAATMGSFPNSYLAYYYFRDEMLAEALAKPTTRAEDILSEAPGYWRHYEEQAEQERPELDPERSRGGIHELELALDVMDAIYNDRGATFPVNVPNNGSIPGFPDDLVVETTGHCDRDGIRPDKQKPLPRQVRGLVEMLAEYQALTAEAAWMGTRRDGIRALASNPLVLSLTKAEAIYDEMAAAHRDYLPDRLLA